MVFEALFKARDIEAKTWEMFLYALIVSFASIVFAYSVFREHASIASVFLITISIFPVIHKILEDQEEIEEIHLESMPFIKRYEKIIKIYFFFFLGITVATSLTYIILSSPLNYEIFREQIRTIENIRGEVLVPPTGYAYNPFKTFLEILTNNLKVAFIAFALSFFFGTGAAFIIAWNSTVIGTFIGHYTLEFANQGMHPFTAYFTTFLSISIHGIPEMIGYFLAGIAGGILSFGVIKGSPKIFKDALYVFGASALIIGIAAFIEVYLPYLI